MKEKAQQSMKTAQEKAKEAMEAAKKTDY